MKIIEFILSFLSGVFITIYFMYPQSSSKGSNENIINVQSMNLHHSYVTRKLRQYDEQWLSHIDKAYFGTDNLLKNKNITIYGAVMNSDIDILHTDPKTWTPEMFFEKRLSLMRLQNIHNLSLELPFELVHWPAVITRPCPQNRHGQKTERGVGLAHYQVWLDFIFFDHDVLKEIPLGIKGIYNSTTWSSTSGMFAATEDGSLYKNDKVYRDDDILVIFEDDAESIVTHTNETILEELNEMTTDILYLGWCEGRLARPVPLCTHAYAVTRRGARILVDKYEPCGKAIDEQMVQICKNGWLTFRSAHSWSYKEGLKPEYPRHGDKTFGIFHQKKHFLGSINQH